MKIAFMSFSTPNLSLMEMLNLAAELGYDGIEPRSGSGHAHGIELDKSADERIAIKTQVAAHEIEICCLAVSCRYANSATAEQNIQETLSYIDLAADLDIRQLRVFGGQIPADVTRAEAIEQVAAALQRVADHAEKCNVTLCLETHDDWCDPNHVAAVMMTVNSPAVAVNWDIMHPVRTCGLSMADAFHLLQPWIKHVHVHDGLATMEKLKMLPIGQGDIDHVAALSILKENGYSRYLSGEWIDWEPYDLHLPRELASLQTILAHS